MSEPRGGAPSEPLRGEVVEGDVVRVYGWEWTDTEPRRGLPWIGIFLVVFGVLLLLEQYFPALETAGSFFFLAIGIAFLVSWAVNRGMPSLYIGSIVTALALPDLIEATGLVSGTGLGTLCLGIAFLFIAAVRIAQGAGFGWQAVVGLVLAAIGGSQLAVTGLSDHPRRRRRVPPAPGAAHPKGVVVADPPVRVEPATDVSEETPAERSWRDGIRRPSLPIVGVLLIALGILLLLERLFPGIGLVQLIGLAAGAFALIAWWSSRNRALLYTGIVLVALCLPALLQAVGIMRGPGWGLLLLGGALIGIAVFRPGATLGWTFSIGGILAVLGLALVIAGGIFEWILPIAVIGLGVLVIARAMAPNAPAELT
jgi:hypothetical protein